MPHSVCWIVPDNVAVNQLFGVTHGLGMGVSLLSASLAGYSRLNLWIASDIRLGSDRLHRLASRDPVVG